MRSLSKSWLVIGVLITTALCASPAFADEAQQRIDEPRLDTPSTEAKHALLGCSIVLESRLCPLLTKEETYASAL
jgi:hypothetical protein